MKLELDLSNPEAMRRQLDEFTHAIQVIKAALAGVQPDAGSTNGTQRVRPVVRQSTLEDALVTKLKNRFTIGDLLSLPDAGVTRGSAKNLLTDWQTAGLVKVLERGKGRKATIYEKINKT